MKKPEDNTGSIHVFRVNHTTTTRSKPTITKKKLTSPPTIPTQTTAEGTVTKNSRTKMSAETKRLICEDHINNPKCTQEVLATKYGCKRTTIAKIIKSKDRWLSIDSEAAVAKRFRQRNSRYPLVENALLSWLQKEHVDTTVVTDQMLRAQARQYAKTFHVVGDVEFKASSSWVCNFKQRYMCQKSDGASSAIKSKTAIPASSPSGSQTPEATNHSSPSANSNASVENMISIAPKPSIMNTTNEAQCSQLDVVASQSFVSSAIATDPNFTDSATILLSTNSNKGKDTPVNDTNTIDSTWSVTDTFCGTEDSENETNSQIRKEAAYDTPVDDVHQDDYDSHYDMMDHCDNFTPPPCFDNNAIISPPPLASNNHAMDKNTQEQTSIEQNNNNSSNPILIPQQQPIVVVADPAGLATATGNVIDTTSRQHLEQQQQQQQQQENTKLSAKQHLEAALAFYTSQNESNASMSANMIKLILQNDF